MRQILIVSNSVLVTWQQKGYVTRALVWLWVLLFVFALITSFLGIPMRFDMYEKQFLRWNAGFYTDSDYVIPTYLLEVRMWSDAANAIVYFTAAVWLVFTQSGRGMALLVAYLLVCFGLNTSYYSEAYIFSQQNPINFFEELYLVLKSVANTLTVWFLFLFPRGNFRFRWAFFYAVAWTVLNILFLLFPKIPFNYVYTETFYSYRPYSYIFLLTAFAIPLCTQIYQHFASSEKSERKLTRWILIAMCAVFAGAFLDYGIRILASIPNLLPEDKNGFLIPYRFYHVFRYPLVSLGYCIFPIVMCAVLNKNDLWKSDPFVHRIVLYSSLTLVTLFLYFGLIGIFGLLFSQRFGFFSSLIATGFVAVLFNPIQQTLRKRINKMLYGQRDEPYRVINELGKGMKDSIDTEATLANFCESTANVLKLPFMGIWLDDEEDNPIASSGEFAETNIVDFPLNYESIQLGTLKVARRSEGEHFIESETALLSTIAQHISVIVHNYLLARALQSSRELIVQNREEDRKRIRRDLHDGLGPTLASTALQLETARQLMYTDPDKGSDILKNLEGKISETLADVRTLVHGLYPSIVDQLGLENALRRELESFASQQLDIKLQMGGSLDNIPAAHEVATYRIIMEAVHNVHKHAKATVCIVAIYPTPKALTFNIQDNGVGFDIDPFSTYKGEGTGLNSMRQRAEELGGIARFTPIAPQGMIVSISLPITN